MWNLPPGTDEKRWEEWYFGHHVPLARQMPSQVRYTTTRVQRLAVGQPIYRLAEQYFPSIDALEDSVASPAGQAVSRDATGYVADLGLYVTLESKVALA
jgi:uncharacterized protein (TIGR02118 family)